jgi:hypothetical protein
VTEARGCGNSRVQGGVYLVTKLVTNGKPLEDFLIDPPVTVPENLHVPYQGMTTFEREQVCPKCIGDHKKFQSYMSMGYRCDLCNGEGKIKVHHIADHIGTSHYPHPIDDIEEVRAVGSSRRIPSNFPFHLLTKESRHFRCHEKSYIHNWMEYGRWWGCPKRHPLHLPPWAHPKFEDMCIGMLWEDYDPPMLDGGGGSTDNPGITVNLPCGKTFNCNRRPFGVKPDYSRAFYMALPISSIDVLTSRTGVHEANYERASKSGLPVEMVGE